MRCFVCIILAFSFSGCLANPAPIDPELYDVITTWAPDPFCPFPSEDILFYSNPDDCSKYIECYEGNKYIRDCADGLLWSEKELACDFPRNVDCSSRPLPPGPDSSSTQPPDEPTTDAPETTEVPVEPTTVDADKLCENQLDGTYLADPTSCKKFYECRAGKAIPGTCPTGSDWNENILNCDRPENVKCQT